MFGGGRDLDLSSKRAKDWKSTTIDTPRPKEVMGKERQHLTATLPYSATVHTPTAHTPTPYSASPRASIQAADGDVLARLSPFGVGQLVVYLVAVLFVLGIAMSWSDSADGPVGLVILVVGGIFLWRAVIGSLMAAANLLRAGGRMIYVEGDTLTAIDPFHGVHRIRLQDLTGVHYDAHFKFNSKSTSKAIVFVAAGGKHKAIGVAHLTGSPEGIVQAIQAQRQARGSQVSVA